MTKEKMTKKQAVECYVQMRAYDMGFLATFDSANHEHLRLAAEFMRQLADALWPKEG